MTLLGKHHIDCTESDDSLQQVTFYSHELARTQARLNMLKRQHVECARCWPVVNPKLGTLAQLPDELIRLVYRSMLQLPQEQPPDAYWQNLADNWCALHGRLFVPFRALASTCKAMYALSGLNDVRRLYGVRTPMNRIRFGALVLLAGLAYPGMTRMQVNTVMTVGCSNSQFLNIIIFECEEACVSAWCTLSTGNMRRTALCMGGRFTMVLCEQVQQNITAPADCTYSPSSAVSMV